MNPSSIRRFVFTLITGYLAIFGVRQIPYDFPNEWGVIIPVLIVVYILTMLITNIVGGLMVYVIRSDRRVWKGHRGPGMLSVVKNATFSVFLLAALLLSVFVPAVGAYSLFFLLPAQVIMRFVERKRPDLR